MSLFVARTVDERFGRFAHAPSVPGNGPEVRRVTRVPHRQPGSWSPSSRRPLRASSESPRGLSGPHGPGVALRHPLYPGAPCLPARADLVPALALLLPSCLAIGPARRSAPAGMTNSAPSVQARSPSAPTVGECRLKNPSRAGRTRRGPRRGLSGLRRRWRRTWPPARAVRPRAPGVRARWHRDRPARQAGPS